MLQVLPGSFPGSEASEQQDPDPRGVWSIRMCSVSIFGKRLRTRVIGQTYTPSPSLPCTASAQEAANHTEEDMSLATVGPHAELFLGLLPRQGKLCWVAQQDVAHRGSCEEGANVLW